MIVENFDCTGDDPDPYNAGRVAGQAMWEIYHGKVVTGGSEAWAQRLATRRLASGVVPELDACFAALHLVGGAGTAMWR